MSINNRKQIIPLFFSVTLGLIAAVVLFQSLALHAFDSTTVEQRIASGSTTNDDVESVRSPSASSHGAPCQHDYVLISGNNCVLLPSGTHKLIFDDEFNSSSVDTSKWTVLDIHGDSNNNEQQCYEPNNVTENGGTLNELLETDNVICPADTADGEYGTLASKFASGAVESNPFSFAFGTIEARIKFAGGTGSWPAFWLLGAVCQQPNYLTANGCRWPHPGSEEIDIAEYQHDQQINQQVHSNNGSPGCIVHPSDPSTAWHVYRLDWHPNKLVFQIDDDTTCTITTSIPAEDMFIIINTAAGGTEGDIVDKATLPQETEVDYVRVFQ